MIPILIVKKWWVYDLRCNVLCFLTQLCLQSLEEDRMKCRTLTGDDVSFAVPILAETVRGPLLSPLKAALLT
jgi:hypothetical protein